MIIFILLWILATVDAAFIGYREAAGRNALIDKRAYFQREMLKSALLAQFAVFLVGSVAFVFLIFSPDEHLLVGQFEGMGLRMLAVFVPYALILLIAFLIRLTPSVDFRSITSVVIFGPFTLIRPIVVIFGVVWGFLYAPNSIALLLCGMMLVCMLGLGSVLRKLKALNFI